MAKLTPLQTFYRGYRFRSRLEARWGVFFASLNLRWSYEPEGFKLSTGEVYLPDFRLDLVKVTFWVEIKPEGEGAPLFEQLMRDLKPLEGRRLCGAVLHDIPDPQAVEFDGNVRVSCYFPEADGLYTWDCDYSFCICRGCGSVGFEYAGRAERIECPCRQPDKDRTADHPRIIEALWAARSARFEHGI